ncbi:MAG: CPBP family glutamic-type intramembrane protease [Acidobacteriota bacterium]|nr:CPBP family glutamic-type intramembrane protease [Acidobacteriota bacterium]
MPYTLAIVAIILGYTWVADPLVDVPGPWVLLPVVVIIALCIAHNRKSRDWGFSSRGFLPALLWSIALTVPLVAALWFIGHAMGPAPIRRAPLLDFLYVMVWGGAQQFVLQTVVLRESRAVAGLSRAKSRGRGAVLLAAAVFASLHLPNPFLVIVTFVGGLAWCWIYSRAPNILPLAVSHAAATVAIQMSFNPAVTNALRTGWRYFQ